MTVRQLCGVVDHRRSLRRASILSTECYAESISGLVHRFLVLELVRERSKRIWLRLDRRAGRSIVGLIFSGGTVPAKDTVGFKSFET